MKEKTAKELQNKVIKDYDLIADDFHKTRKFDWKEFKLFLNFIKDRQRLVDLGCGNGRFYNFLRKHRSIRYVGVDNNEKLLEKAGEAFNKKIFLRGDMTKIPLENDKFDVACVIASFHHIPSNSLRKTALEEIRRILKPNGMLIMSVWNLFQSKYKKYTLRAKIKWLLSFGKFDIRDTFIPWGDSGVKRYYYAFKPKELRKLLTKNGFEIISEHTGRNIIFIAKAIK